MWNYHQLMMIAPQFSNMMNWIIVFCCINLSNLLGTRCFDTIIFLFSRICWVWKMRIECDFKSRWYSGVRLRRDSSQVPLTFLLFWPCYRKNPDTYDTSFESHDMELLESEIKLSVASSWWLPRPLTWKSTTVTKIGLTPLKTEVLPISLQISITTTQGFQKRYITFS